MTIVEVRADDPQHAAAALEKLPHVVSVTQLGVRLRVLVPQDIPAAQQTIDAELHKRNLPATVAEVSASLEDVFVAVTQTREDRAA